MRIDDSTIRILTQRSAASDRSPFASDLTSLANTRAASQLGIRPVEPVGRYEPVFEKARREVREDVTEKRDITRVEGVYERQDITRTEDVLEDRAIMEERDVYEDRAVMTEQDVFEDRAVMEDRDIYEDRAVMTEQDVFEDRAVMEERDIFEDRAVMETRDIYGTQAVYEDRDIMATRVDGTQPLTSKTSLSALGVDYGSDLSVQVGNGPKAEIQFETGSKVSVTVGSKTTNFSYNSSTGSLASAITAAFNSIDGLSASLDANGRLTLQTDNAQSLTIADIQNGLLDFSRSPLAALGLTAGTTNASKVGTETVQTGTEQVVIGTEEVQTGTERVKVGTESVQIGTEQVKVGTQMVQTGTESVKVGTESVQIGTERVKVGTQSVQTGTERVKIGTESVQTGTEQVKVGERQVVIGSQQVKTGEQRVVVGSQTVMTGQRTRIEEGPEQMVGLRDNSGPGVGDRLDLLGAASGGLPAGYVDALFGVLKQPQAGKSDDSIRAEYASISALGAADDDDDKPFWKAKAPDSSSNAGSIGTGSNANSKDARKSPTG